MIPKQASLVANEDSFTSISQISSQNTQSIARRINPDLKKQKLLSALHEIDEDRKGFVRKRVFFNLLECMDLKISVDDTLKIEQQFSLQDRKDAINYETAIKNLMFNNQLKMWNLMTVVINKQGDKVDHSPLIDQRNGQQSRRSILQRPDSKSIGRERFETLSANKNSQQTNRSQLSRPLIITDGVIKNEVSPSQLLYHEGTTDKEVFYRRNIYDYPDFTKSSRNNNRPGTSLSMQSINPIKTNNPYRPNILKQLLQQFKKKQGGAIGEQQQQYDVQKYMAAVNLLNQMNIDYRKLNFLRLTLLKENQNIQYVPLQMFIKACSTILKIPNFEETELFSTLKECLQEDKQQNTNYNDNTQLSLMQLSLVIDLYHYVPFYKKKDKNISTDLYFILSSNKKGQAYDPTSQYTAAPRSQSQSQQHSKMQFASTSSSSQFFRQTTSNFAGLVPSIQDCLQILCDKIDERFKKVAVAFRFFDIRSTGQVSLNDFSFIIDQLQIKFSRQQIQEIFSYLDSDQDGLLTYNDFCALCEERRRQIDPFETLVQKVKDRQLNREAHQSTYQRDFSETQSSKQQQNIPSTASHHSPSQQFKIRSKTLRTLKQSLLRAQSKQIQNEQRLKSTSQAFGMSSDFQKPTVNEADKSGGDMKSLLTYEYERDYIVKAKEDDSAFQTQKKKFQQNSALACNKETMASRKRMESNQRKLKIISQNVRNQELQSPQINTQKSSYYNESIIKKYLNEKATIENKRRQISIDQDEKNRTFYLAKNIPGSFERPIVQNDSVQSYREIPLNKIANNNFERNSSVASKRSIFTTLQVANNTSSNYKQIQVKRPATNSAISVSQISTNNQSQSQGRNDRPEFMKARTTVKALDLDQLEKQSINLL